MCLTETNTPVGVLNWTGSNHARSQEFTLNWMPGSKIVKWIHRVGYPARTGEILPFSRSTRRVNKTRLLQRFSSDLSCGKWLWIGMIVGLLGGMKRVVFRSGE